MQSVQPSADLSRGKSPDDFYVCLISDRHAVEAWRESSAPFDYTIRSSSWCALTCVQNILKIEDKYVPSLNDLFEEACRHGVYVWKDDPAKRGWKGAFLARLPAFLNYQGYSARFEQNLTPEGIAQALASDYYVIARVSPEIRFLHDTPPKEKTGHFVLVYAYETADDGTLVFRIQNSAGFASLNSQAGVPVSEARMAQVFSGDAILVRASH
ncbi:MAG TPA: hypothetical protein PK609_01160 [Candidatus Paceibacterota bacterium]|nr:hypothetical protein [Candidatus Paceibacterota bacterium]